MRACANGPASHRVLAAPELPCNAPQPPTERLPAHGPIHASLHLLTPPGKGGSVFHCRWGVSFSLSPDTSCYADPPMSSEPTGVPAHRLPDGTLETRSEPAAPAAGQRPVALTRAPREPCRRRTRHAIFERPAGPVGGGSRSPRRRDVLRPPPIVGPGRTSGRAWPIPGSFPGTVENPGAHQWRRPPQCPMTGSVRVEISSKGQGSDDAP